MSDHGEIRMTKKNYVIVCEEALVECEVVDMPQKVEVILLDGAVTVHLIRPNDSMKTFEDYTKRGFIPYIERQLKM